MARASQDQESSPEPSPDGSMPEYNTYDPTQGQGTTAWQMSLKHNMEVNARERRN